MIRWQEGRRQASRATPAPAPVLAVGPLTIASGAGAPAELNANFSGYTWHRDFRVWVEWRNGRPVAFWGPAQ
jgi:hypothetical protein